MILKTGGEEIPFALASGTHCGRSLLVYQERKEGRVKNNAAGVLERRARPSVHRVSRGSCDKDVITTTRQLRRSRLTFISAQGQISHYSKTTSVSPGIP